MNDPKLATVIARGKAAQTADALLRKCKECWRDTANAGGLCRHCLKKETEEGTVTE